MAKKIPVDVRAVSDARPEAGDRRLEEESLPPASGLQSPALVVTARKPGFRRAGRAWHGRTEVCPGELTDEQIAQIRAEPTLIVED